MLKDNSLRRLPMKLKCRIALRLSNLRSRLTGYAAVLRVSSQESKEKAYVRMVAVIREKNKTETQTDRCLMTVMLKDMAETHGLNYQTDLLDDKEAS